MAKLSDRTELTTPADGDLYVTTDVSDTTDAATGTDKKITWANIKASLATIFSQIIGTPTAGQIAVWTGSGTLEGNTSFRLDETSNPKDTLVLGIEGFNAFIFGDDPTTADTSGAALVIAAGSGIGTASGAEMLISGGNAVNDGKGGQLNLRGGDPGSTGTGGGDIYISTSGAVTGSGADAGQIIVSVGNGDGVGTDGYFTIKTSTGSEYGGSFSPHSLSGNHTYDLPNASGTILLTADVDDTPVNGATTAPVSSNWAYDHEADTTTHGTTGTIVGTSDTQILTNKRYQPRVYTTANNASLTPEIDTYDIFHLTAMSANTTINNHSTSTPADGEQMRFRFLDNGTARTLSFGTAYVAKGGIALPTTTVLGKNLELGFEYNANLSKWVLLALAQES